MSFFENESLPPLSDQYPIPIYGAIEMSSTILKDGRIFDNVTLPVPRQLLEEARRFEINRSRVFREALLLEVERIKEEQGITAANRDSPCSPPGKRRRLILERTE